LKGGLVTAMNAKPYSLTAHKKWQGTLALEFKGHEKYIPSFLSAVREAEEARLIESRCDTEYLNALFMIPIGITTY
jgi:hypothetical protein